MKKRIIRIIISALIWAIAAIVKPKIHWLEFALFLGSYLIVGVDILIKAGRNIIRGNVFDENF